MPRKRKSINNIMITNARMGKEVVMTQEDKLELCLRQIDEAVSTLIPHINGNAKAEQAVRKIMDASFQLSFIMEVEDEY